MIGCIYSFTVSNDASYINICGIRQLKPFSFFHPWLHRNLISMNL